MFSQSTRLQIRESVLLSLINSSTDGVNSHECQLRKLPRDILWILCQFVASHEEQKQDDDEVFIINIHNKLINHSGRHAPNIKEYEANIGVSICDITQRCVANVS